MSGSSEIMVGGIGNDTLAGGTGPSRYVVDDPSDVVQESTRIHFTGVVTSITADVRIASFEGTTFSGYYEISSGIPHDTHDNEDSNLPEFASYRMSALALEFSNGAQAAYGPEDTYYRIYDNFGYSQDVDGFSFGGGSGSGAPTGYGDLLDNGVSINYRDLTGAALNSLTPLLLPTLGDYDYVLSLWNMIDTAAHENINIWLALTAFSPDQSAESADTVAASISYVLPFGVEDLELTGDQPIDGTGNAFGNHLIGNSAANRLDGLAGNDELSAGAGNDSILGGSGDDYLAGEQDDDSLSGGEGQDWLWAGTGNDTLDGGAEKDNLNGEAGNDVIDAGEGNDRITGRDGDDVIHAGNGNDWVGVWNDWGEAPDLNYFPEWGNDQIFGDAGDDVLSAGLGQDTVEGGTGNDYVAGEQDDDSLSGGEGQDWLWAGTGNDTLDGGTEKDNLNGEAGDDLIFAGDGNDRITGQDGNDEIHAGSGNDWVGVWNDWGEDPALNYFPEWGNDQIFGDAGDDVLSAGYGSDTVDGGIGNDYVAGEQEDDVLSGGEGVDWLWAGSGNDTLDGGSGADVLIGEDGADVITGGSGADLFLYTGLAQLGDRITDFSDAEGDVIDVSLLLASVGYAGSNAWDDGWLLQRQSGADVIYELDQDGGGAAFNPVLIATIENNTLESFNFGVWGTIGDW